jgi:predicted transcriptional regulator of viral defense system
MLEPNLQQHYIIVTINVRIMRSRLERQQELFELADSQRGYFSAAQASQIGFLGRVQHYHKTIGNWLEVMRGIYRLAKYPSEPMDYYAALSLWSHNRSGVAQAVVGFESALLLHELSDVLPSQTHLIVPNGFRKKAPSNVKLHTATLEKHEIQTQQGVQVTTPLRTLVDIAGSSLSPEHLEQAVQQALSRGMVNRETLLFIMQQVPEKSQKRLAKALRTT